MNALLKSLQALQSYVLNRPSQVLKLARGTGLPGTRAAPSPSGTNDTKIGLRIDFGEVVVLDDQQTVQIINLQVNKNAEDPALKELANKDSHKVWSKARIIPTSNPDEARAAVEKLFKELAENAKDEE